MSAALIDAGERQGFNGEIGEREDPVGEILPVGRGRNSVRLRLIDRRGHGKRGRSDCPAVREDSHLLKNLIRAEKYR